MQRCDPRKPWKCGPRARARVKDTHIVHFLGFKIAIYRDEVIYRPTSGEPNTRGSRWDHSPYAIYIRELRDSGMSPTAGLVQGVLSQGIPKYKHNQQHTGE